MNEIKSYLLSITAAAIICAITNTLLCKRSGYGMLVKFLTGIFLTVTIVAPWKDFHFNNFTDYRNDLAEQARSAVDSGSASSYKTLCDIIKSKTEAYILDKAVSMGLDIEVEVTLDSADLPSPESVTIKGAVSPYAKERLSNYIINDLAVPEDKQKWM